MSVVSIKQSRKKYSAEYRAERKIVRKLHIESVYIRRCVPSMQFHLPFDYFFFHHQTSVF